MKQLKSILEKGLLTHEKELELDTKLAFTKWCIMANILSSNVCQWNDEVGKMQFEFLACEETLNMQVVYGEIKNRFTMEQFEQLKKLVQTLQSEISIIKTQEYSTTVANIVTFVTKAYQDDICEYMIEYEQETKEQKADQFIVINHLKQIDYNLLYHVLKYVFSFQKPNLEQFFSQTTACDEILNSHLQTYSINGIFYEINYFVDIVPDKLLKQLFQIVFFLRSTNFLNVFYFETLKFFFRCILLKIKDKQAISHVCKDSCTQALNSITKSEFQLIILKAANVLNLKVNFVQNNKQQVSEMLIYEVQQGKSIAESLVPTYLNQADIPRLLFIFNQLYQVVIKQLSNTIKLLQLQLIEKMGQCQNENKLLIEQISLELKRLRDVLINITVLNNLQNKQDQSDFSAKINLLVETYCNCITKQQIINSACQ